MGQLVSLLYTTRDRLAEEVFERARLVLAQTKDPNLHRFVNYLLDNLFDSELKLAQAYVDCDVEDRATVRAFRSLFGGESPRDFRQRLRFEVAKAFLKNTVYNHETIAELIGMGSASSFGVAFKRATGEAPGAFRDRHANPKPDRELLDPKLGTKIRDGLLDEHELDAILERLRTRYPDKVSAAPRLRYRRSEQPYLDGHLTVTPEALERLKAEEVWHQIQALPEDEQRQRLAQATHFETPALFELLKRKIVEVGREDREVGVRIARLALDAAIGFERLDASSCSALWARAWAYLGNAQRLAFDLGAAEKSFLLAEQFLPEDAAPGVVGEILDLKAALLWYQGDPKKAIKIESRAIALLETLPECRETYVRAVQLRGLLYLTLGQPNNAIEDFSFSVTLIGEDSNEAWQELLFSAVLNLAQCYLKVGKRNRAREALINLKKRAQEGMPRFFSIFTDCLEGQLALEERRLEKAETVLLRAYSAFSDLGSNYAGLVSADLAVLYHLMKREAQSRQAVRKTLGILAPVRREDSVHDCYQRMERALLTDNLTLEKLLRFRDEVHWLDSDPFSRRLLKLRGII